MHLILFHSFSRYFFLGWLLYNFFSWFDLFISCIFLFFGWFLFFYNSFFFCRCFFHYWLFLIHSCFLFCRFFCLFNIFWLLFGSLLFFGFLSFCFCFWLFLFCWLYILFSRLFNFLNNGFSLYICFIIRLFWRFFCRFLGLFLGLRFWSRRRFSFGIICGMMRLCEVRLSLFTWWTFWTWFFKGWFRLSAILGFYINLQCLTIILISDCFVLRRLLCFHYLPIPSIIFTFLCIHIRIRWTRFYCFLLDPWFIFDFGDFDHVVLLLRLWAAHRSY